MAKTLLYFSYSAPVPSHSRPNFLSLKVHASSYPLASKIVVKNLPFSASESRLQENFSKFGQIAEVKLVKHEATERSKGYAFIQYTSQEEAMLALESMEHQYFDGRRLFVEIAKPRTNEFGGYPKTSGPTQ